MPQKESTSITRDDRAADHRGDDRYDAQRIEAKWFERWQQDASLYAAEPNSTKPKYYVLEMLPYPSGALHMGHVRNYAIGDALARYMWMNGYNVLHPMGWDSFGLPAENAAIANNTPPREWTLRNIANMKAQMKRLGFAYDWSREVTTCLPEYYRWNQWFFLKLYEKGMAYRKKSKVNWCPKCATVLANEQVVNGCCWRHEDTLVEQRELEQWFLRITQYAEELLRDLDKLGDWPEKVRTMQRNWIGRSEGTLVDFKLDAATDSPESTITVFTTRVDTIYGATSVQLAPQHPLVARLTRNNDPLRAQVDQLIAEQRKAKEVGDIGAIEKHGVNTHHFAVNPFNGERIPIWVANYILMDYGTGAIMSVPAHDERDFEFARKYNLKIRIVIVPRSVDPEETSVEPTLPFTTMNGTLVNSGPFSGLDCEEAIKAMSEHAEKNGFGKGHRHLSTERLGHLAPALLGHADPNALLRERWDRARPGKRSPGHLAGECGHNLDRWLTAEPGARIRKCDLSEMWRPGPPRDRHYGHLCGFVLVFLSLHRRAQRPSTFRFQDRGVLVPDRSVHRRDRACHSPSHLLALLDQVHARYGIGKKRRTCRALVFSGHDH